MKKDKPDLAAITLGLFFTLLCLAIACKIISAIIEFISKLF